jgi:hypothetical protein
MRGKWFSPHIMPFPEDRKVARAGYWVLAEMKKYHMGKEHWTREGRNDAIAYWTIREGAYRQCYEHFPSIDNMIMIVPKLQTVRGVL